MRRIGPLRVVEHRNASVREFEVNRLFKTSISLAAAAVLVAGATGALAQTDANDNAVPAIPLPEECIVDPINQATVDAALANPEPVVVLPDGLPLPLGIPVDRETNAIAAEQVRQLLACLNAGDSMRAGALFSETGLRGFLTAGTTAPEQAPEATPTPRNEEAYLQLRAVTDVSELADGRIAAFALVVDPFTGRGAQTLLFVFDDSEDLMLIDGVVGFSVIGPPATPTP
jgi:hypothetical protein